MTDPDSRVSRPFDKRNTLFPNPATLRLSISSRFKICLPRF